MIIQLRYHVVSLVAVFLALGLGIIIGVNFGKTVSLELEREIQSLEDTYAQIRADQKILQAALTQKENELNQVECGNQIAIQTQNELFKLINIGE